MEKETLEKAVERLYPDRFDNTNNSASIYRRIFIDGAKWQQERMYNDEEVLSILNKMFEWYIDDTPYHFNLTMLKNKFEQFKKK